MPDYFCGSAEEDERYRARCEEQDIAERKIEAQRAADLKAQFRQADQIVTFVSVPEDQRRTVVNFVWPEEASHLLIRRITGEVEMVKRGTPVENINSYTFLTILEDPNELMRVEKAYQTLVDALSKAAPDVEVKAIAFRIAHQAKQKGLPWAETSALIRVEVATAAQKVLNDKILTAG